MYIHIKKVKVGKKVQMMVQHTNESAVQVLQD